MQAFNVIVPAAGLGTRFKDANYSLPKPLIDVNGKFMLQKVVENIGLENHFTIIIQKSHDEEYNLSRRLKEVCDCTVLRIDGVTDGAARTISLAKDFVSGPTIVANSDQYVTYDLREFFDASLYFDGGILLFEDNHPKWSYAAIENGFVTHVKEKQPISNYATVGIYHYSDAEMLFNSIDEMIDNNDRYNNEFYFAPSYNYAIKNGAKILPYFVDQSLIHGLGTPEDLEKYLDSNKS